MIRAIIRDGVLSPLEPIPEEWADGRELLIQPSEPSGETDLEQWHRTLQELGPARYDPGERERIQALLAEADEQAKALTRHEMGLP